MYINTPILVSHYSKDGQWAYVKTAFAFGWIKVQDLAFVTPEFQQKFQTPRYAVSTTDNLKLIHNGEEITLVKLGTIFPMNTKTKEYFVALKNSKGYAYMERVEPQEVNLIAKKPI